MKKIALIVLAFIAVNTFCFSQTTSTKPTALIEFWVSYSEGIDGKKLADMFIDPGIDNTTNPSGILISQDPKNTKVISITGPDKIKKTFSCEADVIKYLYDLGFEILQSDDITISSKVYKRFIFAKYADR